MASSSDRGTSGTRPGRTVPQTPAPAPLPAVIGATSERDVTERTRTGPSGTSLLLTVLGELVLPTGGTIWTSSVIGALGALGIEERNARQAIARLADSGLVEPERIGRRTRWHLTSAGRDLLGPGAARIYGFGSAPAPWDGRWLVIAASVPEDHRAKRHQLRTRLGFLGFGFLGPGLAISPHLDREAAVTGELERLGLLPGALVFRAEPGDAVASPDLVRRAWDLDELATLYHGFIDEFSPRSPRSPGGRFVALVELVHAWRRFPFVDPEFPPELLPSRWVGGRAKTLFDAKHSAWSDGALAWYAALDASDAGASAGAGGVI